jgi:hypothetical protein
MQASLGIRAGLKTCSYVRVLRDAELGHHPCQVKVTPLLDDAVFGAAAREDGYPYL